VTPALDNRTRMNLQARRRRGGIRERTWTRESGKRPEKGDLRGVNWPFRQSAMGAAPAKPA
jgi:hypothetical protein